LGVQALEAWVVQSRIIRWFAHCVCRARVEGHRIDIKRWSHCVTRNSDNIVGPQPAFTRCGNERRERHRQLH